MNPRTAFMTEKFKRGRCHIATAALDICIVVFVPRGHEMMRFSRVRHNSEILQFFWKYTKRKGTSSRASCISTGEVQAYSSKIKSAFKLIT